MAQSSLVAALSLPALTVSPVTAFWRWPCKAPVLIERADPVVNPGVASPHLHTIMGGSGFGFSMDYAQTQASQRSTCAVPCDARLQAMLDPLCPQGVITEAGSCE